MTTCQCCGQHLTARATAGSTANDLGPRGAAIWVDDALMRLCNRAYELADTCGAREVGLAHVAAAFAASRALSHTLARFSISPSQLAADATRAMAASGGTSLGGPPRTSADLRSLLADTKGDASLRGATVITGADVLQTLYHAGSAFPGAELFFAHRMPASLHSQPSVMPVRAAPASVPQRQGWGEYTGARDRLAGSRQDDFRAGLVLGRTRDATRTQALPNAPPPNRAADPVLTRLQHQERLLGALLDRVEGLALTQDRRALSPVLRHTRGTTRAATALALAERRNRSGNAYAARDRDRTDWARGGRSRDGNALNATPARTPAATTANARTPEPSADSTASRSRQASGRGKRREQERQDHLADRLRRRSRRLKKIASEPLDAPLKVRDRGLRIVPSQPAPRDERAPELDDETIEDAPLEDDLDGDGDAAPGGPRQKRFYLAMDDYILHAPSIGPSTAGRLMRLGINTVRDLMACDPAAVAARVNARHVSVQRIAAWQAQARLVCTVPWLRGTHAQLLVGAGFDTVAAICAADRDALCVAILKFSATRSGMSVLRSGPPPEIEKIVRWVEHANLAEVERAA